MTVQGTADDIDAEDDDFDLAPTRLSGAILGGRYQVVGYLSQGATSRVYVARDLGGAFGTVVVKMLTAEAAQKEEFRALMLREGEIARPIDHPNVVRVLDLSDGTNGPIYVVMEALVGEVLGELLRREGPLGAARAIEFGLQIGRGLEAAHAAGVVHRDVKPDNIFVMRRPGEPDQLKILDFGMAKLRDSKSSAPHTVLGTAAYMSPEQILAEPVDARSDVYSFGVVLFRMLTGHLPFDADAPADLLRHQLFSAMPPLGWLLDEVSPGLSAIVVNATRKDPANRYPSMTELLADLERLARGDEPEVTVRPLANEPDAYEPVTEQGERAVSVLAKKFGAYARLPEPKEARELRSRTRLKDAGT